MGPTEGPAVDGAGEEVLIVQGPVVVHTDCHPINCIGHSLRERCRGTACEPQLFGAGQKQGARIRFVEFLGNVAEDDRTRQERQISWKISPASSVSADR
jgi:hypothetical protein